MLLDFDPRPHDVSMSSLLRPRCKRLRLMQSDQAEESLLPTTMTPSADIATSEPILEKLDKMAPCAVSSEGRSSHVEPRPPRARQQRRRSARIKGLPPDREGWQLSRELMNAGKRKKPQRPRQNGGAYTLPPGAAEKFEELCIPSDCARSLMEAVNGDVNRAADLYCDRVFATGGHAAVASEGCHRLPAASTSLRRSSKTSSLSLGELDSDGTVMDSASSDCP